MTYPLKEDIYLLKGDVTKVVKCISGKGISFLCLEDKTPVTEFNEFDWMPYFPDYTKFRNFEDLSLENLLTQLAGLPDFAVTVMVWPWPDGGWMAGLVVLDYMAAKEQGLLGLHLKQSDPDDWDLLNGFAGGENQIGDTPKAALVNLTRELLKKAPGKISL